MSLKVGQLLIMRGKYPMLGYIAQITEHTFVVEFDSDGYSFVCNRHLSLRQNNLEKWKPGLIVYCSTGKSRFTLNWKTGYYLYHSDYIVNPPDQWSRFPDSTWLGTELPGESQEEFHRAYKLKVFW